MDILYVGKHGNVRSNDDEGAIASSLKELGHRVRLVQEHRSMDIAALVHMKADILLFHHYRIPSHFAPVPIPKVFWCFDRIHWEDDTLQERNERRRKWIAEATDVADVGFMTDGDWIANDKSGKLHWLTQGFNQYLPVVPYDSFKERNTILFTGGRKGGVLRESFVREMIRRYPNFLHLDKGCHGLSLSKVIAEAAVVVAPDSPVTERYWSNRVYLTLGLGGFLLHPYTKGLTEQYPLDLAYYQSREDLHDSIRFYMNDPDTREAMQCGGRYWTLQHHTYKHRCEQLITIVKERLSL